MWAPGAEADQTPLLGGGTLGIGLVPELAVRIVSWAQPSMPWSG
jgi:hypothetical protein